MALAELFKMLDDAGVPPPEDPPAKKQPSESERLAPEFPFDDLWKPVEAIDMPIPNMGIAPGPVHLVTGSWYTGKTVFLLLMGLAVASGGPVLNLGNAKHGRWIHFDHEMGQRGLRRYLQRVAKGLKLRPEQLRDMLSIRILPQLNLVMVGSEEHYVRLLTGYQLATFDPLRVLTPGKDENSSDYRQWLDMLGRVSLRTGCSIVVLHHDGKPSESKQRKHTGRGSSAIDDAVQSKFVLTAASKGAPVKVSHEKSREREGGPLEDFYFRFVNGKDSVSLQSMDKAEFDSWTDERFSDVIKAVLMRFGGAFVGDRKALLKECKGDRNRMNAELTRMVKDGEILSDGEGAERRWGLPV